VGGGRKTKHTLPRRRLLKNVLLCPRPHGDEKQEKEKYALGVGVAARTWIPLLVGDLHRAVLRVAARHRRHCTGEGGVGGKPGVSRGAWGILVQKASTNGLCFFWFWGHSRESVWRGGVFAVCCCVPQTAATSATSTTVATRDVMARESCIVARARAFAVLQFMGDKMQSSKKFFCFFRL
jgi:hypothetical protein